MIPYKDLCVIFINRDEPNAEENYQHLLSTCPHNNIIRVEDATSFEEAATFTCERSTTDHFILVDADNKIDSRIWNDNNYIPPNFNHIISFAALNHVNGLCYGNGSIKLWNKHLLNTVLENADGKIDLYHSGVFMNRNECYSTTYINGSPYQAFRSAFREVVKLTLIDEVGNNSIPIQDFETYDKKINTKFRKRMKIWCSVGRDVVNGEWSILGARMGAYINMTQDTIDINSFSDFEHLWNFVKNQSVESLNKRYYDLIIPHIQIMDYSSEESKFFKDVFTNPPKFDYMSPEHVALLYPQEYFD